MSRLAQPCLTVRLGSQLKDFPIHTVQIGERRYFTIDGNHKAKSVVGIVQKHYGEKIVINDDILLLKPISKQPWELSKDKVKLSRKLGEGAFGEVWQGTLRQSPTHTVLAAIKVTKLKEDNKRYMQELYKEARLMRQYQHINVVGFFGMVLENDNVMIVMEMVNGGGLDHYLKRNFVSIPDKCSYSFDVALGLYYLHSKRCMHRDLACRNCLIDIEKNIVKISDFGLSKQADVYKIQPSEKIPTKWQAPEVVATFIYTRECDVYSYGILIWEIFNNAKMPFGEYDNKTVRQRVIFA
ncbi:protein tyrosine kinase [Dictyocaulus viviparus]|uniref:Protein tyrosine kinase n=1 Tax=Dictyocaulus viviparus TaxID=29172 RepID=A0A0D8XEG4_DICVI|nr:protein tyrosine kinase [Dictyocaulus viviparus]